MIDFNNRSKKVRDEINERFGNWGIDGEEAYKADHIFPEELKSCNDNHLLEILENNQISHIMPVSKFPEFKSDIRNVFLEDPEENMSRGAEIVSDYEFNKAHQDMLNDIKDRDYDEDGFVDVMYNIDEGGFIEDIAGTVIPIGLVMTGAMLYKCMKNKEVKLEEAPRFFFYNTGKKTIRVAVVGTAIATGSPIVVGGMLGYFLYKSENLIKSMFKGIYKGVTSDTTKSILKTSGIIVLASGIGVVSALKGSAKLSYKVLTSDTSKAIGKGIVKGAKMTAIFGVGATYLTFQGIVSLFKRGISSLKSKPNNE